VVRAGMCRTVIAQAVRIGQARARVLHRTSEP
jgi:hypothetical protein